MSNSTTAATLTPFINPLSERAEVRRNTGRREFYSNAPVEDLRIHEDECLYKQWTHPVIETACALEPGAEYSPEGEEVVLRTEDGKEFTYRFIDGKWLRLASEEDEFLRMVGKQYRESWTTGVVVQLKGLGSYQETGHAWNQWFRAKGPLAVSNGKTLALKAGELQRSYLSHRGELYYL